MILSYGVRCSRLIYASYCGEMESRGYVVVGIEHQNGTGPSSTIRARDRSGTTTDLSSVNLKDLQYVPLPSLPSSAR
jgi:platelet-activating factor acetylhydrolase